MNSIEAKQFKKFYQRHLTFAQTSGQKSENH